MESVHEPLDGVNQKPRVARREFLRLGAIGGAAVAAGAVAATWAPSLRQRGLLSPDGVFDAASIAWADSLYVEAFPTSPLILNPFSDPLVIPPALLPDLDFANWANPPGPGDGQQSSLGNAKHQRWCGDGTGGATSPLVYRIELKVDEHWFTTSQVLPIDKDGKPTGSFDASGKRVPAGPRPLPASTIYGFNGTFPGPMINAEYGQPNLVRFVNNLDEDNGLDRQDFGSPGDRSDDYSFLTHLHNGHNAPESDGNPAYTLTRLGNHGYPAQAWVDNLYLNWPAGGDDREKQSFLWFHDHRMDHTGSNVYKGMVGLYPIYDPGVDCGDETKGLRLPGVRTDHDGTFDVKYDIPLAFYDARLDDGVTIHQDFHDGMGEFPAARNPRTHPEWWGKTFYKHFPSHGFVGDLFTVNGTAYPVLEVERRKYRFRFLNASVARIYDFQLMSSTRGPKAARDLGYQGDELQGQYRIPDGQQCMRFTQIATEGGLLPAPIPRDNFECWPAKRVEVIIDFTKFQDGTPTTAGKDVVYLTNTMKMTERSHVGQVVPVLARPELQDPDAEVRHRRRPPEGSAGPERDSHLHARRAAGPVELEGHAEQPVGVRAAARQRRRRGRVVDQRPGLRPGHRGAQHEEPGRQDAVGAISEGTASASGSSATAAVAGCTRCTCTRKNTASSCATANRQPVRRRPTPMVKAKRTSLRSIRANR